MAYGLYVMNVVKMEESLYMIGGLGPTEIILILFIVILLFGAKRLPDLAKGLGNGIREFKNELHARNDETSLKSKVN